jgi:ATP-dependent DNA helicase PIF1
MELESTTIKFEDNIQVLNKIEDVDNMDETFESSLNKLNKEQKSAYDKIMNGESLFIGGAAGSGKSFLLSIAIQSLRMKENHRIEVTGSTGISAINLGRMLKFSGCSPMTLHSWSGAGTSKQFITTKDEARLIAKRNIVMDRWITTDTLFIEEISMISPYYFQRLYDLALSFKSERIKHRLLKGRGLHIEEYNRKVRENQEKGFAGIQIIACGDWAQLEPVRKSDPPEYKDFNFCFETNAWKKVIGDNVIILNQVYRQKDPLFVQILSEIRHGVLTEKSKKLLLNRRILNWDEIDKPISLFPTIKQVQDENTKRLIDLKEEEKNYIGRWEFKGLNENQRKTMEKKMKDIYSIEESTLILKKGCSVYLSINLSTPLGLVNGLQGKVVGFSSLEYDENGNLPEDMTEDDIDLPIVLFENGLNLTVKRFTWYESWEIYKASNQVELYKVNYKDKDWKGGIYSQIPLKLGFSISIHKSQGMGFQRLALDIGKKIFTSGQVYTGLSRCETLDGLYLLDFHVDSIIFNEKVIQFYEKYSKDSNYSSEHWKKERESGVFIKNRNNNRDKNNEENKPIANVSELLKNRFSSISSSSSKEENDEKIKRKIDDENNDDFIMPARRKKQYQKKESLIPQINSCPF